MESIFESKEQFHAFRKHFKTWYNTEDNRKQLSAKDFALYAILRNRDWRKCFSEHSSKETIGWIESYLTKTKPQYLYLAPFGEFITEEMIATLREQGIQKWGE